MVPTLGVYAYWVDDWVMHILFFTGNLIPVLSFPAEIYEHLALRCLLKLNVILCVTQVLFFLYRGLRWCCKKMLPNKHPHNHQVNFVLAQPEIEPPKPERRYVPRPRQRRRHRH